MRTWAWGVKGWVELRVKLAFNVFSGQSAVKGLHMMRSLVAAVVVLLLGTMAVGAEPANAQVERDAAAIADRYLAAMGRKGYGFLPKEELGRRREVVAAFVVKWERGPLDEGTRGAMLEGIDRCLDRLYSKPAGQVDYSNGFGSGGEEWVYLNDRDYFLTFQYHLWFGLTHPQLAAAEVERRDQQRQWMRKYLTELPFRGMHETPPREGMRNEDVRPWALAELEKDFADPMHLLSEPMSDERFGKLQKKGYSNGIWEDFHGMEVAGLTSRFPWKKDPAGRYGYAYSGKLPFDDTVVDLWGNGPSLCFASNADIRGHHGGVSSSAVFDVMRCIEMQAHPAPAAGSSAMETWLAKEGRGELGLDDATLVAVRGAKMAELAVKNWFEADKLSEEQLRKVIRDGGGERISVKRLPRANGMHRGDRSEGEFFMVVQSREGRLAVVNLFNYEFKMVSLWCRPRAVDGKALVVPATP